MKKPLIDQAIGLGASLLTSANNEPLICFTEKQLIKFIDDKIKKVKLPKVKPKILKSTEMTMEMARRCNIVERRGFKNGKYEFRTKQQLVETLIQFEPFKSMVGNKSEYVRETIIQMVANKRLVITKQDGWEGYVINSGDMK